MISLSCAGCCSVRISEQDALPFTVKAYPYLRHF